MPRRNKVDYDRFDICKLTDIRKTEFFSRTESKLLNPQTESRTGLSNYDRRYENSRNYQRRSRSRTKEQSSIRHFSRNINIQKKIVDTHNIMLRDDYQHRRNSRPVSRDRIHSTTELRHRYDSNDFNDKFNLEVSDPSKRYDQFQKSSRVQTQNAAYLENQKPIFNESGFLHTDNKNDSKRPAYDERELIHDNGDDRKERLNCTSDFYSSSRDVVVHEYREFSRSNSRNSLTDDSYLPRRRKVGERRESFDDSDDDRISKDPIFRRHTNESNVNSNRRENSYRSNYEPVSSESVRWLRKNRIETNSDRLPLNNDNYLLDKTLKDERGENQHRQDYKPVTEDEIEDDSWSRRQRIRINFDRPQPSDYFHSGKNINDERIDYRDEDNDRKCDEFKGGSYVSDRQSDNCQPQRSLRNTRWRSRSRSREKQANSETFLHSTGVNTSILNSVKNREHYFKDRIFHGRNELDLKLNKYESQYQQSYKLRDGIDDIWQGKQRTETNSNVARVNDNSDYFTRRDKKVIEEKIVHCDIDRKCNSNKLNDYELNLESYDLNRRENPYQNRHVSSPKEEIGNVSWPEKRRKEINFVGPQVSDNSRYFSRNKTEQKMDIDDRKYKDIDDRLYKDIDDRQCKGLTANYSSINDRQTALYQYQRKHPNNARGKSNSRSKEPMDSFKHQISKETLTCERFQINGANTCQNNDSDLRDRFNRGHTNELKFDHRIDTTSDRLESNVYNDYLFGKKFEDYRIDFDKSENDRKYNEFEPNSYIGDRQPVSGEYLSRSKERSVSPSDSIILERRQIDSDITDRHNYLSRTREARFKCRRSNFEASENRNIPTDTDLEIDDSDSTSMRYYDDGTCRQRESDIYSRESPIGNTEIAICDQKEEILHTAKSNYDFEGLNYWYDFFKSKSNEDVRTVWNSVSYKNQKRIEIYCMVCNHYFDSVPQFQIHTGYERHSKSETDTFGNNPPAPIIVRRSPLVVRDVPKHFKNDIGTFGGIPPRPEIVKQNPPVVRDVPKQFENETETFGNIPPPPVIVKSSAPVVRDVKQKRIVHVNDTKPESWKLVRGNRLRQIFETSLYTGRSNVIFDDLYNKFHYFALKAEKKSIMLRCNLCDLFFYFERTFEFHTKSKKHLKALRNCRGKGRLPTVNRRKVVRIPTGINCDICEQYGFDSVYSLKQHKRSEKHKKNFRDYREKIAAASTEPDLDKSNSEELVETASVDSCSKATIDVEQKDNPTDHTFYYCSICDLTLNSLQQYDSHLISKNHANKKRMVENLTDE